MFDIDLFIILIEFFAAIVPLIAELVILPTNIKQYQGMDKQAYESRFRICYQMVFFNLLILSFLLKFINKISPILFEHALGNLLVLSYFIFTLSYILTKYKFDKNLKIGMFYFDSKFGGKSYFLLLTSPMLLFFIGLVDLAIDREIAFVFSFSTLAMMFLFNYLQKRKL
ncbi:hypothetical protein JXB41_08345 [Candidatus Woesearchaeota archaeon]|nr:hypothetical protein [Candidatus Woesearchaeota archaeon]